MLIAEQIFGRDQIFFPAIVDVIGNITSPLDPIKLPYTIRVDQAFHNNPTPTIYDIRVAMDDTLLQKMVALTTNPQYTASLRSISDLDDRLAVIADHRPCNISRRRGRFKPLEAML